MKKTYISNQFILAASAAAKLPLTKRFALAVVVFGGLSACGDEGAPDEPPPTMQTDTYTCTASITPSSFEYRLEGDVLHLIVPGQSDQFERVAPGHPNMPVFGTWHITTQNNQYGTVTLDMEIEPDQVTAIADCDFGSVSATAEANSRAVITDNSITILDSDEDTEVVYGN